MNNNRELLDAVFSEEEFQASVIGATLDYSKQRKRRRNAFRAGFTLLALCCLASIPLLFRGGARLPKTELAAIRPRAEESIPGTDIRLINDEELLKLFSGRPVAFVGQGNQRSFIVLDVYRAAD